MKIDELKARTVRFLNSLVDLYFPDSGMMSRLANTTTKFYIEQHTSDFDALLKMFCSSGSDDIDVNSFITHLENDLFKDGSLKINVKEMLPSGMSSLSQMLPDKVILLTKDDLRRILD